ncbi:hypothetical protein LPJ70_007614, partial [Coemansia sp. RSA 2708]
MRPHIVHFERDCASDGEADHADLNLKIEGHISKPIPEAGRSGADKQYFFVNGRPCDFPKAKKLINELYRSYSPTRYPVYAIAVSINAQTIDVNLTPDKRSILIRHESQVLDALRQALTQVLEPSESTFSVSRVQTQLVPLAEDGEADSQSLPKDAQPEQAAKSQAPRTLTAGTSVPGVIRCYVEESTSADTTCEAGRKRAAAESPEPNVSPQVSKPRLLEQIQHLANAKPATKSAQKPVAEHAPFAPKQPALKQPP